MEMEDDYDCGEEGEEVRVWRVNVFKNKNDYGYTPSCSIEEEEEDTPATSNQHIAGDFKIVRVPPSAEASASNSQDYEEQVPRDRQRDYERVEEGNNVEFMKTLHEAYEAATEQQEQDRQEMAALEEVILMLTNHNPEDMKNVLENIYSQNGEGRSMAGALARFFQQQLQDLLSKHELRVQELQSNLSSWMQRCEELQANGVDSNDKEDNQGERHAFIEKLHKQLGAKNNKLQKLNNVVHQLERKIASLTRANTLEGKLNSNYEQTKQHSKQLQEQVSLLKQQKQQLQSELCRFRELKPINNSQMKEMEEELQREREKIEKLTRELAKYRKKEKRGDRSSSSSSSSKEHLENHVKHLNEKLSKVEQKVKEINKTKKDVRDEVTDIEEAFLQTLGGADSSSLEKAPECFEVPVKKVNGDLGKFIESLDSKLKEYENELRASEMHRRSSEKAVLDLNEELKRLKKNPKTAEECCKIKQLVEQLEELEAENRDLRHVIAVDKEEQIMKLEKELRKLKLLTRGSEPSQADELEQIIEDKDRLILELRFQCDQAKKRTSEVEAKFDILFKEWFEETSTRIDGGSKPLFGLPDSKHKGEVKKENELQLLVYTMKRVVDKLRKENTKLKQAGLSEARYQKILKKNKELKSTIDLLNFKIAGYSPHMQLPVLEKKVQDLTEDIGTLTDVNAELIHVLKQAEDVYPDIKDKISCKSGAPFGGAKYFADCKKRENVLAKQTQEIARLQEELNKATQLNNDLIYQIAKKEDELDLVHGKLYVRSLIGVEGVKKNMNAARDNKELKSHATTVINNGCFEVMPGDYMYNKNKAPKDLQSFDAQLVDEIEELRLKHQNLTEVCKHYEQLLYKYTEQLEIPFKPLKIVM